MAEEVPGLRVSIDGDWLATDMSALCSSLAGLYNIRLMLGLYSYDMYLDPVFAKEISRQSSRFRRRSHWVEGVRYGFPLALWEEGSSGSLEELIYPTERLTLARIKYASPGFADFTGVGTAVGHVKDFALKLIERRDTKNQRDLADKKVALEIERMRIENLKAFVELARDVGYSDMEVRQLVRLTDRTQQPLLRLVNDEKIVSVEDIPLPTSNP